VSGGGGRIRDWDLEQLAAGQLDARAAQELRARLASDGEATARWQSLRASNQEILQDHPPEAVAAEVQRRTHLERTARASKARSRSPARMVWLLAPAGLAAAFLLARPQPLGLPAVGDTTGDEVTRPKGPARLWVYRKAGEQVQRLTDGALVRPHDMLQLAYSPGARSFGAVLSVDGRGVVTLHLPEQAGPAPRLKGGGAVPLPRSYELDAAPGFERFVFATADRPFAVSDVARALETGKPLPVGIDQTIVTLRKESP
jgi:hypothetical protein